MSDGQTNIPAYVSFGEVKKQNMQQQREGRSWIHHLTLMMEKEDQYHMVQVPISQYFHELPEVLGSALDEIAISIY